MVTGATVEYLAVTQPYSPLALYSYAPAARDEPYAHQNHGQGETFSGLLWVEQDCSHGQTVTWQVRLCVCAFARVFPLRVCLITL